MSETQKQEKPVDVQQMMLDIGRDAMIDVVLMLGWKVYPGSLTFSVPYLDGSGRHSLQPVSTTPDELHQRILGTIVFVVDQNRKVGDGRLAGRIQYMVEQMVAQRAPLELMPVADPAVTAMLKEIASRPAQ